MPLTAARAQAISEASFTAGFVSLHTAEPNDSGSNEASGGGYARQEVTLEWDTDAMTNDSEADFGEPSVSWGTITHVGLFTLVSGGTFVGWAPISPSIPGAPGVRIFIEAGSFRIRVLPAIP
jgi:hypothetical protein